MNMDFTIRRKLIDVDAFDEVSYLPPNFIASRRRNYESNATTTGGIEDLDIIVTIARDECEMVNVDGMEVVSAVANTFSIRDCGENPGIVSYSLSHLDSKKVGGKSCPPP